jgi:hypothetical protein
MTSRAIAISEATMSKALIAAWYKYRRVAWLGGETIEDNLRRAFEAGWWACEEQGRGATLKAQGAASQVAGSPYRDSQDKTAGETLPEEG